MTIMMTSSRWCCEGETSMSLSSSKSGPNQLEDCALNMSSTESDVDFPTPQLLREGNDAFHRSVKPGTQPVYDKDGKVVPYPARYKKSDIFKPSDYANIDKRACSAPKELLDGPLQALVDYLIQGISTDMGKLRAIFRWITNQDPRLVKEPLKQQQSNSRTMMDWLYELKCQNYPEVFAEMCSAAGIQQVTIRGHAKGCRYKPGEEPDGVNGWSAVLINNAYYLVDTFWGSLGTNVSSKEWVLVDDNGNLSQLGKTSDDTASGDCYRCNENWFLTNPEEMIYTHRPHEDKWQLLARAVSKKEFKEMALLDFAFFSRQLLPDKNTKKSVLYADNGEIEMTFRQPNGIKYKFSYKLWLSDEDAKATLSTLTDEKLERFAQLEHDQNNLMVRCAIVFPFSGKFKIEFQCSDPDASGGYVQSPAKICSYIIHAKQKMKNIKPLPENNLMIWGPTVFLPLVGLRPVQHCSGTIHSHTGEVEVVFDAAKNVNVLVTLHSNTRTAENLKKNVIHFFKEQQLVILVRLPEAGDYALNLYASDKGPIPSPPKVCCYLIKATKPASTPREFPAVPDGRIGPTGELAKLAMRPKSHPSAYFKASSNGLADLIFAASCRCFNVRLLLDDEAIERQVFVVNDGGEAVFKTRFPRRGQYVLEIYGANEVQKNDSLPLLFTYLIEANNAMMQCPPFPMQTMYSTVSGFELVEPPGLCGHLVARKDVSFKLKVPGAKYVATITTGSRYTNFTYDSGFWKGVVNTGEPTDQFTVVAKLDKEVSYTTYLVFSVVDSRLPGANEKRNSDSKTTREPLSRTPSSSSYMRSMAPAGRLPPSTVSSQFESQGQSSGVVSEMSNLSIKPSTGDVEKAKSDDGPHKAK